MSPIIDRRMGRYERGRMTRRDLFRSSLSGLAALALAPSRVMGQSQNAALPIPVTGWSHPTFHPQYLNLKWYQRVFGLPIMYHQVHQNSGPQADGPNVKVGDGPAYLWFRPDTAMAARQHWSIGVKDWNLDRLLRAMVEMGLTGGASPKNTEAVETRSFLPRTRMVTGCSSRVTPLVAARATWVSCATFRPPPFGSRATLPRSRWPRCII